MSKKKKNYWQSAIDLSVVKLKIISRLLANPETGLSKSERKEILTLLQETIESLRIFFDGSWKQVKDVLRVNGLSDMLTLYTQQLSKL
jgi:hypothetical protein